MKRTWRLQRRLMAAFASFVLFTAALFGLYAMAFMYSVEDTFFETMLEQEAAALLRRHAQSGEWGEPRDASVRRYADTAQLPDDLRTQLIAQPHRHEFAGSGARHYHVLAVDPPAPQERFWLVAEVSAQLVVRPMRNRALLLLGASGLAIVVAALAIGAWLARRTAGPLARLAALVDTMSPDALPRGFAAGFRADEVGTLARGLEELTARVEVFVAREQEFTRDASHELRTPLAVIRGAAEGLSDEPGLTAAGRAYVAHIRQSALQLEQTVATLLALAREDRADEPVGSVAVLPLLERIVIEQAPLLDGKPVTLDVDVAANVRAVLPAPVLHILLSNLVGNAFAHTAAGKVRIDAAQGRLRVANSAEGADPSRRWQLPQPFGKGEGSTGFGLGLVILRRLCDRYGIDLRIDEAEGGVMASMALAATGSAAAGDSGPGAA